MEMKKENGKVVTTMSFSECFFGYDDPELSKLIIDRFDEMISYPYQPERSKREDSECDFCKGDCKCLLRQKKRLFITESIKNEEVGA